MPKTREEIEWEDEWRRKLAEIDDEGLHIGEDLTPRTQPPVPPPAGHWENIITKRDGHKVSDEDRRKATATARYIAMNEEKKTKLPRLARDPGTYRGTIDFEMVNGKNWRFVLHTFNETVEVMTDKLADRTRTVNGEKAIVPLFFYRDHDGERVPTVEWDEGINWHWAVLTPDAYAMWFNFPVREKALQR